MPFDICGRGGTSGLRAQAFQRATEPSAAGARKGGLFRLAQAQGNLGHRKRGGLQKQGRGRGPAVLEQRTEVGPFRLQAQAQGPFGEVETGRDFGLIERSASDARQDLGAAAVRGALRRAQSTQVWVEGRGDRRRLDFLPFARIEGGGRQEDRIADLAGANRTRKAARQPRAGGVRRVLEPQGDEPAERETVPPSGCDGPSGSGRSSAKALTGASMIQSAAISSGKGGWARPIIAGLRAKTKQSCEAPAVPFGRDGAARRRRCPHQRPPC